MSSPGAGTSLMLACYNQVQVSEYTDRASIRSLLESLLRYDPTTLKTETPVVLVDDAMAKYDSVSLLLGHQAGFEVALNAIYPEK